MDHFIMWYRELGGIVSLDNINNCQIILSKRCYAIMLDHEALRPESNINKGEIVPLITNTKNKENVFDNLEKINTNREIRCHTRYKDIGKTIGLFASTEFYDYCHDIKN